MAMGLNVVPQENVLSFTSFWTVDIISMHKKLAELHKMTSKDDRNTQKAERQNLPMSNGDQLQPSDLRKVI